MTTLILLETNGKQVRFSGHYSLAHSQIFTLVKRILLEIYPRVGYYFPPVVVTLVTPLQPLLYHPRSPCFQIQRFFVETDGSHVGETHVRLEDKIRPSIACQHCSTNPIPRQLTVSGFRFQDKSRLSYSIPRISNVQESTFQPF